MSIQALRRWGHAGFDRLHNLASGRTQAVAEVEQATYGGNLGLGVVDTQTTAPRLMESRLAARRTRLPSFSVDRTRHPPLLAPRRAPHRL